MIDIATARRLAESEAGSLVVFSEVDEGTFWVFFRQSEEFVKTRDPADMLLGVGPIIVDRNGSVRAVAGYPHPDYSVETYRILGPGRFDGAERAEYMKTHWAELEAAVAVRRSSKPT